ncbi:MAG: hypothetical protein WD733_01395 [Bryobacterales bacterium]
MSFHPKPDFGLLSELAVNMELGYKQLVICSPRELAPYETDD